jgi:PD-(D/E)XK nuclease superfamily
MRIDASRYSMFWANPERYRLRELWKLAPQEPKAGTFASLLTFGRRRGTCLHELLDADYRGVSEAEAVQGLRDGGFNDAEIEVARNMAAAVRERYQDEERLVHEALFEYPIEGSPHSMVGRIDGIHRLDGDVFVNDYKSSKHRSKKDLAIKLDEYCRGPQVSFYLLGAPTLGFITKRFRYVLVSGGREAASIQVNERFCERSSLELAEFARQVAMTCDLILWMKKTFGIERPWPQIPERFGNDYAAIAGQKCYEGYIPEGFTTKKEHLPLDMEVA